MTKKFLRLKLVKGNVIIAFEHKGSQRFNFATERTKVSIEVKLLEYFFSQISFKVSTAKKIQNGGASTPKKNSPFLIFFCCPLKTKKIFELRAAQGDTELLH